MYYQKELILVYKQRSEKTLSPIDKIFWMRIGLGVLAGIIAGALGYLSDNPHAFRAIGIGFMMYFASYIVTRLYIAHELLPSDYRKMITTGMAGYVFMFLFSWILYNTFVFAKQIG